MLHDGAVQRLVLQVLQESAVQWLVLLHQIYKLRRVTRVSVHAQHQLALIGQRQLAPPPQPLLLPAPHLILMTHRRVIGRRLVVMTEMDQWGGGFLHAEQQVGMAQRAPVVQWDVVDEGGVHGGRGRGRGEGSRGSAAPGGSCWRCKAPWWVVRMPMGRRNVCRSWREDERTRIKNVNYA